MTPMMFVIGGAVALCFVGGLLLPGDYQLYSTNFIFLSSMVLLLKPVGAELGNFRPRHLVRWLPLAVVWFAVLFTAEWLGRGYGDTWGPA
jgi:hypothetical protein